MNLSDLLLGFGALFGLGLQTSFGSLLSWLRERREVAS